MLQVTNGVLTLEVSNAAFKTMFEPLGYRALNGAGEVFPSEGIITPPEEENVPRDKSAQEDEEIKETPETEDENTDEEQPESDEIDYSEIPLEEMEFDELCGYADQLGVDRTGVRSKKILRNLIREELNDKE